MTMKKKEILAVGCFLVSDSGSSCHGSDSDSLRDVAGDDVSSVLDGYDQVLLDAIIAHDRDHRPGI